MEPTEVNANQRSSGVGERLNLLESRSCGPHRGGATSTRPRLRCSPGDPIGYSVGMPLDGGGGCVPLYVVIGAPLDGSVLSVGPNRTILPPSTRPIWTPE